MNLWTRLARLDTCCEVSVTRVEREKVGSGDRPWRVTILKRGEPRESAIVATAPRLVEALVAAAMESDRRGW